MQEARSLVPAVAITTAKAVPASDTYPKRHSKENPQETGEQITGVTSQAFLLESDMTTAFLAAGDWRSYHLPKDLGKKSWTPGSQGPGQLHKSPWLQTPPA